VNAGTGYDVLSLQTDKIGLWLSSSDSRDREMIMDVGVMLKSVINWPDQIFYETHESTMNKTGSTSKFILRL
jgi:hypothetical protein